MIKVLIKYFIYFVLLILLQIFVLNNIQLSGYINPMIYVLFILLLPFETSGWLLLLLGFATGLTIDMFMSTLGMHSSATIALAYARPHVISLISQRVDVDFKGAPRMNATGIQWYIRYTIILVFIHHLFLFLIETFSFSSFFPTLWRIIISTLITSSVVLLAQYFTTEKK